MLCVIFNSAAVLGASPLTAARRGVTAQEEKKSPTRTTARNPNVRSFTIIISAFAKGKILKGCRVRIVPNCSAFRKRNRFGLQPYQLLSQREDLRRAPGGGYGIHQVQ